MKLHLNSIKGIRSENSVLGARSRSILGGIMILRMGCLPMSAFVAQIEVTSGRSFTVNVRFFMDIFFCNHISWVPGRANLESGV